jgi:hypothetical protein
MNMLSKKSALLCGAVLAVCAFAVPSMASAASWSPLNTTHQLTSPDLQFTANLTGTPGGSSCADSEFDAEVFSAAVIEITGAVFRNCSGTGGATGCTATPVGNNFPWTATARTTTDIQIHRVDVSVVFDTKPGGAPGSCAQEGFTIRVTGTLVGGVFDPSSVGANRRITYTNATGTTAHLLTTGLNAPATVLGTIRDTTATLNVLD